MLPTNRPTDLRWIALVTGTVTLATALQLSAPQAAVAQTRAPLRVLASDQSALNLPNTTTIGIENVNAAGDFVFVTGSGANAIFIRRAGAPSLSRLLQAGDPVPGIGNSRVDLLSRPMLNANGHVLFGMDYFGPDGVIRGALYVHDGSSFHKVVASGDTAPGTGGYVYGRSFTVLGLDASDNVAFASGIVPGTYPTNAAAQGALFFAPNGGAAVRVAMPGDPAPGTGGSFGSVAGRVNSWNGSGLTAQGEVMFSAAITGGNGGYGCFLGSAGGVRKIVAQGDSNLKGETFTFTGSPCGQVNNVGQVQFYYNNTIYLSTPATGLAIAADLTTALPVSLGGTFTNIWYSAGLNDSAQLVFLGSITGSAVTSTALFRYTPGNPLDVVAYANQVAPGLPGRAFSNPFTYASIESSGQVAFGAGLTGSPALSGYFRQSGSGAPTQIVLSNQTVPLAGGGTYALDMTPAAYFHIHDGGRVYFESAIAGGSATVGAFLSTGATITPLVSDTDQVPAGSKVALRDLVMNGAGDYVEFYGNRAGSWIAHFVHNMVTGTTSRVVAVGDPAPVPSGGKITSVDDYWGVFVNAAGKVAFTSYTTSETGYNLFLWDASGGVRRLVGTGTLDSTGKSLSSIGALASGVSPINAAGQIVFTASNPASAIYVVAEGSAPVKIAAVGDTAPTGGTFTSVSPAGSRLLINASGHVVFGATTSLGATGIFIGSPGTAPAKVVATGDAYSGGGAFSSLLGASGLNDGGAGPVPGHPDWRPGRRALRGLVGSGPHGDRSQRRHFAGRRRLCALVDLDRCAHQRPG